MAQHNSKNGFFQPTLVGFGRLIFTLFVPVAAFCFFEAISKRPLELNIRVGPKRPILEILNVCLRLAASPRHDLEPD